ncbi:hypothetical protein [Streptomyces sp. NPDC003395]
MHRNRQQRTGIPRQHAEPVVDGQEHAVRLGVWLANQKKPPRQAEGREQRALLAALGIDWA